MAGLGEVVGLDGQYYVDQAVVVLDGGLEDTSGRELASTDKVTDLLLDVRVLLVQAKGAIDTTPDGRY